jgi:hypothetical protein
MILKENKSKNKIYCLLKQPVRILPCFVVGRFSAIRLFFLVFFMTSLSATLTLSAMVPEEMPVLFLIQVSLLHRLPAEDW